MGDIIILDYQMGNFASVVNMLRYLGHESIISNDKNVLNKCSKLILPGVGAFDAAVKQIKSFDLWELLSYLAIEKRIHILGICLGMQLLTNSSEEGLQKGLGWIDATTYKFSFNGTYPKIPHMGWNVIRPQNNNPLFKNLGDEPKFYFVHSYYVKCQNNANSIAKTKYEIDFDSAISNNDNIFGCQFHPEKSHKFGMQVLDNFVRL